MSMPCLQERLTSLHVLPATVTYLTLKSTPATDTARVCVVLLSARDGICAAVTVLARQCCSAVVPMVDVVVSSNLSAVNRINLQGTGRTVERGFIADVLF